MLLVHIVHDLTHLGEGNVDDDSGGGTGIADHLADAVHVHAGVDHVGDGAQLVQGVDGADGFGDANGDEAHHVAFFDAVGGKGIGGLVNTGEQLPVADGTAVVIEGGIILVFLVDFLHEAIGGELGNGMLQRFFGVVLQPRLFLGRGSFHIGTSFFMCIN